MRSSSQKKVIYIHFIIFYIYSLYHILTSIARQNSNKIQRKNPINNTFFYRSVVFVCLCGIDENHIFCYNYYVYFAARGVRLAGRSGVTDKTLRYLITNAPTALRVQARRKKTIHRKGENYL